ncbi:MAG TPA: hypothetical protein VIV40_12075 [Kofleriaceae bacterium]
MRRLVLLACLVPGVAFAQGAPPPPPDPGAPAPTVDPNAPPAPAPAPAPAPPPPNTGYYQPAQPVYGPPPQPRSLHSGLTFEANLGIGWIHASTENDSDTRGGIGGLSLGLGGWLNPKLALTARIAGSTVSVEGGNVSDIFFGPSLQYWVDDHFWLGGGLGLGLYAVNPDVGDSDSISGLSFDLRVGYTFNTGSAHSFNASFELTPGRFTENGVSATLTSIGILFGYQYL